MTLPRLALAAGAVLVISSFFLPYNDAGVGSAIAGHGLADLVLSGTISSWAPRWIGLVLYLLPLGGALVLVGLGLDATIGRVVIGLGIAVTCSVSALFAAALGNDPIHAPGSGSWVLLCGLVAWATAGVLALAARAEPAGEP